MNKKKWMRKGIALALSAAMTAGVAMPPATAEANTGRIIGAIVGGAVAADEMSKQIKEKQSGVDGQSSEEEKSDDEP